MSNILKQTLSVFVALAFILQPACTSLQATDSLKDSVSTSSEKVEVQKISLTNIESKTRQASVKIYTDTGGHGSGAYFLYEGYHVVFTAAHVVAKSKTLLVVDKYGNKRLGTVAYTERGVDFAIILIPAFGKIEPIKFRTPKYNPAKEIGKKLIFSGYPGRQSLRTVRGQIAGVEGRRIVVHSTAWKGSSGSCVFDADGNFVGVLFALSMSRFSGKAVLLESMIWVEPYTIIDWASAKKFIHSLN